MQQQYWCTNITVPQYHHGVFSLVATEFPMDGQCVDTFIHGHLLLPQGSGGSPHSYE